MMRDVNGCEKLRLIWPLNRNLQADIITLLVLKMPPHQNHAAAHWLYYRLWPIFWPQAQQYISSLRSCWQK